MVNYLKKKFTLVLYFLFTLCIVISRYTLTASVVCSPLWPSYEIGTCGFSAKHTSLSSKSNDWLARNQDNVTNIGVPYLSIDCCFSELEL